MGWANVLGLFQSPIPREWVLQDLSIISLADLTHKLYWPDVELALCKQIFPHEH